jgi:hypothetical protein
MESHIQRAQAVCDVLCRTALCHCHASRISLAVFKGTAFDYRQDQGYNCVTSFPGLLPAVRESDVGGTVMLKWHCLRWIVCTWLLYLSVQGLFSPFLGLLVSDHES